MKALAFASATDAIQERGSNKMWQGIFMPYFCVAKMR